MIQQRAVTVWTILCLVLFSTIPALAQAQTLPSVPLLSIAIESKTDVSTYRDLAAQISRAGTARVIVQLKSPDEPLAQLKGMQSRSKKARQARRLAVRRLQGRVLRQLHRPTVQAIQSFKHVPYMVMEVDATSLEQLGQMPEVEKIWEDRLFKPILDQSVPQMGANVAFLEGYTGEGFAVAVLDTGVDLSHSAFIGKPATEACFSTTSVASASTTLCPNGINPGGGG